MATLLAICGAITALFKALPTIIGLFTKSQEQTDEAITQANQAEADRVAKGGRPS
jgi:hypothetical protein